MWVDYRFCAGAEIQDLALGNNPGCEGDIRGAPGFSKQTLPFVRGFFPKQFTVRGSKFI